MLSRDFTPISQQSHTNFNALLYFYLNKRGRPLKQGGNDYVFRFGMVLVDDSSGIAGNFDSVQGQIYEMVEQTPAGKGQRTAWEMGDDE